MINGKKVILRPMKATDIKYFLKWFNDQEVIRYLVSYLPITEESEKKWIEEKTKERQPIFMIEVKKSKNKETIGNCGFNSIEHKDRTATFGIEIGEKKYWGRGYGTEAAQLLINYGFQTLNLNRISSSALAFNERSIKMHKKVGFKKEGRQRQRVFSEDKYHDLVLFGILKEEWK